MDAVGGDKGVELRLNAGQCLVALFGSGGRIGVKERREVVAFDSPVNDVVLLRALEFDDPQIGPGEMNTVGAFRVTGHLAGGRVAGRNDPAIVEPHQRAILKHGEVGAVWPFPGLVGDEHNLAPGGGLQLQGYGAGRAARINKPIVHEHFYARADGNGLFRGLRREQRWLGPNGGQPACDYGKRERPLRTPVAARLFHVHCVSLASDGVRGPGFHGGRVIHS